MSEDERYMRLALEIAEMGRGQTSPNPLVGAVVIKEGTIVGQGAHLKAGTPHAEVHALRMAGRQSQGAVIYVTLEPCNHTGRTPPCTEALIASGVRRVVVAAGDPNPMVNGQGLKRLRDAGIEVTKGVLAEEAHIQNEAYFTWRKQGRAFVHWKCATTLDGCTAASSGHSTFVTGPDARASVQNLRRQYPAIGIGIGTVLADDPRLTVRSTNGNANVKQPTRVIFDGRFRFPAEARMVHEPGGTWIYTTQQSIDRRLEDGCPFPKGEDVEIVTVAEDVDGHVDLRHVLIDLGNRGLHSILMEGGATLMNSFIQQRLVDKVTFYVAPKILGGGVPVIRGNRTEHMSEAVMMNRLHWSMIGEDVCLEGYPVFSEGHDNER